MPEEEQTGELVTPATLPKLDSDQKHMLGLAKKYCQEITGKHVSSEKHVSLLVGVAYLN